MARVENKINLRCFVRPREFLCLLLELSVVHGLRRWADQCRVRPRRPESLVSGPIRVDLWSFVADVSQGQESG